MYPLIYIGPHFFPTMSLILMGALTACLYIFVQSELYSIFYFRRVIRKLIIGMTGAFFGGKILSILTDPEAAGRTLLQAIMYSGFVFYGGLLGAILAILVFYPIEKRLFQEDIPFLYWTDLLATLIPLAQAIGRIGCFFNGCCYGKEWEGFPGILYPIGYAEDAVWRCVFPTWFFESGFCLILFFVLRGMWKKQGSLYLPGMPVGRITVTYLVGYSVFRFILEFFRGDSVRGVYGPVSTSQIISIIVAMISFIVLFETERKKKKGVSYYD